MIEEELQNAIEKYLLGEMLAEERQRFESAMAADPELREEVEIQRIGLLGLQQLAASDLHKKFAEWNRELDAKPLPKTEISGWMWASAALFLLLMATVFGHLQQQNKTREREEQEKQQTAQSDSAVAALQTKLSNLLAKGAFKDSLTQLEIKRLREELDRTNQAPHKQKNDPNAANRKIAFAYDFPSKFASTVRSGSKEDPVSVVTLAAKAFDTGQYSTAERLLKSIPPDDPRQDEVIKILPYALFYNEKFGEAAAAFAELQQRDKFEAQKAEWYIVLCYVAEGREAYAQKALSKILGTPQHKYYEDAKKLKSTLENR